MNSAEVGSARYKLYQKYYDCLPDGITIADSKGNIIYASPVNIAMYGYSSADEITGRNVLEFIAGEDQQRAISNITNLFLGVKADYKIYRLIKKNGDYFYGEIEASVLYDESGAEAGLVAITRNVTSQKKMELKLHENEEKYRLLIENMKDVVWSLSTDLTVTYVSPSDEQLRGFPSDEIIGRSFYQTMTDESTDLLKEKIRQFLSGNENAQKQNIVRCEARQKLSDGTSMWTEVILNGIWNSSGIFTGFHGVTRNINDRKLAENAALEQSEVYHIAINNAPIVFFKIDSEGIFRLSEGSGLTKLGLKPGQVVGLSAYDVYRDFPDICDQIRSCLAGNKVHDIITVGNIFFEIIYNPIINKKKQVEGLIGIAIDITDRNKIEADLRESEFRFRTLFESMAEGVALHDLVFNNEGEVINYRIIEVNPSYARHTGLDIQETRGKLATDIYGTDIPPYFSEFSGVALSGKPYHFETYFPPLDRYFRISVVSPGKNRFATVFEDITVRKLHEQQLKEKNEELERFTYTVSHDLKSPLVTITGFIGILEEDIKDGNQEAIQDNIRRIKSAADKMSDLLNDLLELSRIGRFINPSVKISMKIAVDEALELLSGIYDHERIKINVMEKMPDVFVDKQRMKEVWQNLIENSLKFAGSQTNPEINIGFEEIKNENIFYIRDNGEGIDPKYHETVFGLFNKLDNKSQGTGIGLALVRRIIDLHGGRIWIESSGKNSGTTIKFIIPENLKRN